MLKLEQLVERQAWSLDRKVQESLRRIVEWYEAFQGDVFIAYSGGKDSEVLAYLVHSIYPDVPAVFTNTGLEYPEIVKHVRKMRNLVVLRPRMRFREVIQEYGYPAISKKVARVIYKLSRPIRPENEMSRRLYLEGINSSGEPNKFWKLPDKWRYLLDADVKLSDMCCEKIKHGPQREYQTKTGRAPYIGMMASDGMARKFGYLESGCNSFDLKYPRSNPLGFWLESDIWDFIHQQHIDYCPIYDMGYTRTGCMFCMFGVHIEWKKTGTNRFLLMEQTHPRHWSYCINKLGCGKVLDLIKVPYADEQLQHQLKLFDDELLN